MRRAAFLLTVCSLSLCPLLLAACSPELGDTPFACSADSACPESYSCRSSVCVKEGASVPTAHPKRVTWINAGEMFWLTQKGGGAELIVNDGFSPGARGIYSITVSPDGAVASPRPLLLYGGEVPMSSSVIELADGRYGIVSLSFPDIDGDDLTLTVRAVERLGPDGAAPSIETLYTDKEPFLGGTEPAYISALAGDSTIDFAWTRPSLGGRVEVVRLAKQGAVWKPIVQASEPLPPEILPLSGDCALWKTGPESVLVRVGFEQFAVAPFDLKEGTKTAVTPFKVLNDIPIYGWADRLLLLRYGAFDGASASYRVSYALSDITGKDVQNEVDDGGVLQEPLNPYTALPSGDGALFGPMSADPSFPTLEVASRSPTQKLTPIASIKRGSSDRIYSARAFKSDGKVYFAWTEFHESLMDLWVAVAASPQALSGALIRPPTRAASFAGRRP